MVIIFQCRLELRKLSGKKSFEVLVVSEISRHGRNPFQIQQIIEELSELKISIHIESLGLKTIDENGNRSPMVEFILSILMQLARMEREFLIQRVKSGLNHAKSKGKVLGRPQGSTMEQQDFLISYQPYSIINVSEYSCTQLMHISCIFIVVSKG